MKIVVTGSSGFVADYIIQYLQKNTDHEIIGISRSGLPRFSQNPKVKYFKADCLKPETLGVLKDADAIVHTVGTLAEINKFKELNTDSAINSAKVFGGKKFVLISSAKAPPGLQGYITTKIDAENYLKEQSKFDTTIIQPGFIWDASSRWWSVPLRLLIDLLYWVNIYILRENRFTDFIFPARSTHLNTISHFVKQGVEGQLKGTVTPEMLNQFEY